MSDLFVNRIVGFPTRWLKCINYGACKTLSGCCLLVLFYMSLVTEKNLFHTRSGINQHLEISIQT